WMAMAMPQLSRVRPRSPVIGRVKRPKLVRMPLPMAAIMQPATISTSRGTAGRRAEEFIGSIRELDDLSTPAYPFRKVILRNGFINIRDQKSKKPGRNRALTAFGEAVRRSA